MVLGGRLEGRWGDKVGFIRISLGFRGEGTGFGRRVEVGV